MQLIIKMGHLKLSQEPVTPKDTHLQILSDDSNVIKVHVRNFQIVKMRHYMNNLFYYNNLLFNTVFEYMLFADKKLHNVLYLVFEFYIRKECVPFN